MKNLYNLEFKPEKRLKNEELITLKGGSEGETGYKCYDAEWSYLGCVNLVNCNSEIGEFYCHWCYKDSVHANFDCAVSLENCYQW